VDELRRLADRAAMLGGPAEAAKAARLECRVKGHSWAEKTFPTPDDPRRVVSVKWCWKCLRSDAALWKGRDTSGRLVGSLQPVTAMSTTGRAHIVGVIPPYRMMADGKRCAPAVMPSVSADCSAKALCATTVYMPQRGTSLVEAIALAEYPLTCSHCIKIVKRYETKIEDVELAGLVQTRTHYLLRYSEGKHVPGVSRCSECRHPAHFHFDCVEDECACQWALENDYREEPAYIVGPNTYR